MTVMCGRCGRPFESQKRASKPRRFRGKVCQSCAVALANAGNWNGKWGGKPAGQQ